MRADFTGKLGLALAIRFFTVTAGRAGARSITRVNSDYLHACNGGFVLDKAPELPESPIRLFCSLALSNRSPLANVRKFFNRYRSIRALSLQNNLFRDAVVFVGLVAALSAAHLAEFAVSRASTDLLYSGSAFAVTSALVLYALARVAQAVAISRNLSDAEVNAKRILNLFGSWFQDFADGKQKEIALVIHKVGLALSGFKQLLLSLAADVRNLLTTAHRPDGDELLFSAPCQNPIVKRECAKRLEIAASVGVQLVGVRNFGNRSDHNLSRQIKAFSNVGISQLVQVVLLECLSVPSNHADSVTSGVGFLKRSLESLSLFFRRIQFDLCYQLHDLNLTQVFKYGKFIPD